MDWSEISVNNNDAQTDMLLLLGMRWGRKLIMERVCMKRRGNSEDDQRRAREAV